MINTFKMLHKSLVLKADQSLTDKIDEKAAIMDQHFLPLNSDVHLDKHPGFVQMADEQPLPTCSRDDSERAPAAVLIPAQERRQTTLFRKKKEREDTHTHTDNECDLLVSICEGVLIHWASPLLIFLPEACEVLHAFSKALWVFWLRFQQHGGWGGRYVKSINNVIFY